MDNRFAFFRRLGAGAIVVLFTAGVALAAPPVFEVDHEFFPYYPSLIKWNKSNAEFTDPET